MKNILLNISIAFLLSCGFSAQGQDDNYLLMVIDVQEFENVKEEIPTEVYQDFLKEVNGVIESFEKEKVIYIRDLSLVLSLSFKGKSIDTVSFPNFEPDLKIVNEHVFIKTEGDSFTADGLEEYLLKFPDHKIVVIGLIADGCIFITLKSGVKHDYDMYMIPEAILARSEISKEKYFRKYKKMGVKIYKK
ncbi:MULTISPECIES: isochorismatase family protein [unclassified Lentimicrobium]|uniref:isochorismatase family protein n=1 Tax=unclassified Lentimicrobium TaxID=2677434 RepID=UPI001552F2BD|nr:MULTISPECIES: isochorismatase family protein [unclassified Lentimicrobium]NPD44191.1 isochorismatase family protein [Lentimicrobium sp. S6]NPD84649.1 isochorismatase family protein [Lentimicrobium sp. L6]